MGTKVEYSINLLAARATSVDCNNSSSVKGMHVWEHYQSSEGHRIGNNYNLQFPMERRMLDRNIVESIKKTMQMHEDIFKHQVQELHRVYSVQKKLMDELKKENREKKQLWTPMIDGSGTSQSQAHDTNHHYGAADFQAQSSRERSSGSCCEEHTVTKIARGFDLEMPAEDQGTSNGCDEGEAGAGPRSYTACAFQSGSDEEMEVDLTLSIGGSNKAKKKKKKKKIEWHVGESGLSESPRKLDLLCASFKSDRVGDCSDPTTPMSSSSVTFEQERKEPQFWLSQGLKLK